MIEQGGSGFSDDPKHMDAAIAARKAACDPLELIYDRFWARLNASAQRDIDWMNGVRKKAPVPQSVSVSQEEVTKRISASIDKMSNMYRAGWTLHKIAKHFKVHSSTAHNNLLKAGVMMRKRGACRP